MWIIGSKNIEGWHYVLLINVIHVRISVLEIRPHSFVHVSSYIKGSRLATVVL